MKKVRAHVIITGVVQGVFFRAHTQKEAEKHTVFGWVKNKEDETVEAVFEGKQAEVEALVQWCHTGPPFSQVDQIDIKWGNYTGKFLRFSILY
ncbi:MAG: acylphosphatase [Proteobacteria bacterium]|nr:acylphosphatase [Pseudomonadota bacterium]